MSDKDISNLTVEVVGLRVEHALLQKCEGHNCDFTKYEDDGVKYIFLLIDRGSSVNYYELTLYEEEGECMSGWMVARYGMSELKKVSKFSGKTHLPIKQGEEITLPIKDNELYMTPPSSYSGSDIDYKVSNDFFTCSEYGEDHYYPEGYVHVNMDKFKLGNPHRVLDKRPVWIYYGESCSGKSYLTAKCDGMHVYETDMNSELPKGITASIIVLGNKYKFTIEDVKSNIFHLDQCDVILVNFSRKDEIKKLKTKIEHLKYKPSEGYENIKLCVLKTGKSRRWSY